jgi:tetratricopeptide (TPR) repeat protein
MISQIHHNPNRTDERIPLMNLSGRIAAIGCLLFACALPAMAQKAIVLRANGKQLTADSIIADDAGNLTYKDGSVTQKIRRSEYRWARVPKPKEIAAVEQLIRGNKYADAAVQARALYDKFKFLGYDVNLIFLETMCLSRAGKDAEAIPRLEILNDIQVADLDPQKVSQFFECRKLLADLYIKGKQFDKASKILNELLVSPDDNLVAFALNAQGDILYTQNKKRDAALMFLRTALLFPKENKERPKALVRVANTLKEMSDNRSTNFAEILQKDYPGSSYIQELK